MPKMILRTSQKQNRVDSNNVLNANYYQKQVEIIKLEKLLRRSRSKGYMNAIHKLDAGGHVHNHEKVNEIISIIKSEFPEIELAGILLGIVAKCYLGMPYEVHTIDIAGEVIKHYQSGQILPDGLERARNIAVRGGYEFIEVYKDCCRAISSNGSVSVIRD